MRAPQTSAIRARPQEDHQVPPKIHVVLKEGLGNQLFQFAAGLWAAQGELSLVSVNLESFKKRAPHGGYALAHLFDNLTISRSDSKDLSRRHVRVWQPLTGMDSFIPSIRSTALEIETILDGWFFNYAYVEPVLGMLQSNYWEGMSQPTPDDVQFYSENDVIGIHFRRGDYLIPYFREMVGVAKLPNQLTELRRVVQQFKKRSTGKPIRVVAFSDGEIKGEFDRIYMRPQGATLDDDIRTMRTMSLCKHLICPNSTFSLWAAYLSKTMESVSVPSHWYRKYGQSSEVICPPNGTLYKCDLL